MEGQGSPVEEDGNYKRSREVSFFKEEEKPNKISFKRQKLSREEEEDLSPFKNEEKIILISSPPVVCTIRETVSGKQIEEKKLLEYLPKKVTSLKTICLNACLPEIASLTSSSSRKEADRGEAEEDSWEKIEENLNEFLRNKPFLPEELKTSLKEKMLKEKRQIWERWLNLSSEQKQKAEIISVWGRLSKKEFFQLEALFKHVNNLVKLRDGVESLDRSWDELWDRFPLHLIKKLDLTYCSFAACKPRFVKNILSFLSETKSLTHLDLSGIDSVTDDDDGVNLENFIGCLNKNPSLNLKVLILENMILSDENEEEETERVLKILKESSSLKNLTRLSLSQNVLEDGIDILIKYLKEKDFLPSLRVLNLQGSLNYYTPLSSIKPLTEALSLRPCFKILDVRDTPCLVMENLWRNECSNFKIWEDPKPVHRKISDLLPI
jgi:hypothetical protein